MEKQHDYLLFNKALIVIKIMSLGYNSSCRTKRLRFEQRLRWPEG
ncbi:hypothetical protein [Symbiopectobacterium sp. RP]